MKKFLMFIILSLMLVACSTSENGSTKEDKKTESTKDTKKGKKNNSKDESDKSKDESDDSEDESDETKNGEETKEGKKSLSKSKRPITLKNEMLVDNELFSITVKNIDENAEYEGILGYAVNLLIENKSPDKTYTFIIQKGDVNGVEVDPFMLIFVSPGKKANKSVVLDDLKEYGIEEYTDIELTLDVVEGKDWYNDPYVMSEPIHIYPYGKENAGKFVYKAKTGDQVLVDNEYVTVIYTGDNKENELGYSINLYIVNKTDKDITVSGDDMSINGYMVGADFFKDVSAGKASLSNIQWYEETFKENDIDESKINDIEFSLDIYPPENIEAEHFFNGMLKITP